MHERTKLSEAKYFLKRLETVEHDRESFLFELSAFLSAARSVLQYAHKEATSKPGGQAWYEAAMKTSRTLDFFKDARDLNIHEKPTDLRVQVSLTVTDTIHISDSIELIVRDTKGNIISQTKTEPTPPPESTSRSESSVRYFFTDWSGTDEVRELCTAYVRELDSLVSDGIRRGFISG